MNKEKFIQELSNKTGYSKENCTIINSVLEDNFLIGKKNKDKIITSLKEKLNLDDVKANRVA